MGIKKNKRTLKKRIRRVMSIVLLIVVVLFTSFQLFISSIVIKGISSALISMVASIGANIINGDRLASLGDNPKEVAIYSDELDKNIKTYFPEVFLSPPGIDWICSVSLLKQSTFGWEHLYSSSNKTNQDLDLLKRNIAAFSDSGNNNNYKFNLSDKSMAFMILDSQGNTVGIFLAEINPTFPVMIYILLMIFTIVLGLVSYILSIMLSRVFTITITKPLDLLAEKINDIANAKNDFNKRIEFKKPYREIEVLASATNAIMKSTQEFIITLEEQNRQLEDQNCELEAQKEELEAQRDQISFTLSELKETQVQLVQSEKMASLGLLTAGVAHEINTPIGAINSNSDTIDIILDKLLNTNDLNDSTIQYVKKLQKSNKINKMACERIIDIVKNLKNFSRLDEADFQLADIHEGIESVLVISNNLLKHNITVMKNFGAIPRIQCYPNQLNQVFVNLIVNAAQAIDKKGTITITTRDDNSFVYIDIEDDGIGIPQDKLKRIFDPGYTTKGVGIGTGLGLSICYSIIQKHHGEILVASQEGSGTKFTVKLPKAVEDL